MKSQTIVTTSSFKTKFFYEKMSLKPKNLKKISTLKYLSCNFYKRWFLLELFLKVTESSIF